MPADSGRLRRLEVIDVAVGGDVHRIVLSGVKPCPGDSVRAQMTYLREQADDLRRFLISDPYGAEHMCVDLLVPAQMPGAELGFVIMEVMGYPYFSGSNSIATAAVAIERGLVGSPTDGDPNHRRAVLEAPDGLVAVDARLDGGRVVSVTVEGEAAYVIAADQSIDVPGLGKIQYDLMWSGGLFVMVDADALDCEVAWVYANKLANVAQRIIEALHRQATPHHPVYGDVGPPGFLHFMGPLETLANGGLRAPAATYGHPGVIWRSPTGTGASARLALMSARGQAGPGTTLAAVSPKGHVFNGTILRASEVAGTPAVRTSITARPYRMAHLDILVDLDDPSLTDYELDHLLSDSEVPTA